MTVISAPAPAAALLQSTLPVRSPRTSLILAELARQRRRERRERRKARVRRVAWLAAFFNRKAFDLIRVQCPPHVIFAGPTPMVYVLPCVW